MASERRQDAKVVTADLARKARSLRAEGIEWDDIVARLGRSVSTLQSAIKRLREFEAALSEGSNPRPEMRTRAANKGHLPICLRSAFPTWSR